MVLWGPQEIEEVVSVLNLMEDSMGTHENQWRSSDRGQSCRALWSVSQQNRQDGVP